MKTLRQLRHFAAALLAVITLTIDLCAGDIVCVVSDASGTSSLPGATITLLDSGRKFIADATGRFRVAGLPAGNYQVTVSYAGYDTRTQAVTVPAQGEVTLTITLGTTRQSEAGQGEVIQLEKFVVGGFREGRSRAFQEKRNQTNIADIVSADAIGNLPDRNVAEAVARLPGVNMSLDQGEGRYVSIRGAEPNLNQVLMDGATMAAPGGSRLGRAVPLDTLGAGQISSISVIKSVTPDLDANAVGGTINITSRSAFDHDGRFLAGSVSGIRNGNDDKFNTGAEILYSDQFGKSRNWGLAASASYDKRSYANEWVDMGWAAVTINGTSIYVPNNFQLKPESGNKTRQGTNLNLEYKPDADTHFYLRPGFSKQSTHSDFFEVIYRATASAANVTLTSPTAGLFRAGNAQRREMKSSSTQELLNVPAGMKKKVGRLTFESMLTYSGAKQSNDPTKFVDVRNATGQSGPLEFDIGSFVPARFVTDPAIDVPANYTLQTTRTDWGVLDEDIFTAKGDVRFDADRFLRHPGFIKVGVKYLQRNRVSDLESRRFNPVGWTLAAVGPQRPSVGVYGNRFQSLFRPDVDSIYKFIENNPNLVVHNVADETANSTEDDYKINEYIYSAYVMGSVTLNQLTLLGGVRWEDTDATIRSVEVRTQNGRLLGRIPKSGTTNYGKFFPNLQAVYRFNDRLLARAAFTETIGRPAYEDARPLASFTYTAILSPANPQFGNTGGVNVGNPQLKPYDARNVDLSLEWYAANGGGVITLGAFRKDVKNPIYGYSESQFNVVYSGVGLERLDFSSRRNADAGRITGLELNVYQPFRFLPRPFDGFGIDANYTRISSSVKIPTRPGEDLPFFNQPDEIIHATLFYETSRFSGRVAYTYASEQLVSVGGALVSDTLLMARGQYDALFSYRISNHYRITASVRNITREPEKRNKGLRFLLNNSRLLDRDYRVSLDFKF